MVFGSDRANSWRWSWWRSINGILIGCCFLTVNLERNFSVLWGWVWCKLCRELSDRYLLLLWIRPFFRIKTTCRWWLVSCEILWNLVLIKRRLNTNIRFTGDSKVTSSRILLNISGVDFLSSQTSTITINIIRLYLSLILTCSSGRSMRIHYSRTHLMPTPTNTNTTTSHTSSQIFNFLSNCIHASEFLLRISTQIRTFNSYLMLLRTCHERNILSGGHIAAVITTLCTTRILMSTWWLWIFLLRLYIHVRYKIQ